MKLDLISKRDSLQYNEILHLLALTTNFSGPPRGHVLGAGEELIVCF